MSEYGIKIKNISAGMLYDVNLGTRDYFTYTEKENLQSMVYVVHVQVV